MFPYYDGMHDDVTGEITVFCDAESHVSWEQKYVRRGDGPWLPDMFENIGDPHDPEGQIRTPRRLGGLEYLADDGTSVRVWDSGRGVGDRAGVDRFVAELDRARGAAGPDDTLDFARRYQLRCPLCGDRVRRADAKLQQHFNLLWAQDITRISISGIRVLEKLV